MCYYVFKLFCMVKFGSKCEFGNILDSYIVKLCYK